MNKLKLTLFANDMFMIGCKFEMDEAIEIYPWIDVGSGFKNMVEELGYQGKHGEDENGFRIVAVSIGEDNEYTDVATLFVASHFDKLPSRIKRNAEIIDETEIDYDLCNNLFSAKLDDERTIAVNSYSSLKPFARFNF